MKKVNIIGIGMSFDTVTREGIRAVESSEVLLGAARMTAAFPDFKGEIYNEYLSDAVKKIISECEHETFSVLVSGDTGFYSACEKLCAALSEYEVSVIPGISSLNYFFAKLKTSWQDAALLSCHGRDGNIVETVRRNKKTFVLTGGNIPKLGEKLCDAGFSVLKAYVGENLGTAEERITETFVSELSSFDFSSLSVMLIENPEPESEVRFGIPDEEFLRGKVPMTKSEIRAVTMSALCVRPDSVCYDVGAGTGSVTVEMALAAYGGKVFAVERNEEAVGLIRENLKKFHIGNAEVVPGFAPEALEALPAPDAVFIGGSGGGMDKIFEVIFEKNPKVRVVVNAIAIESVSAAVSAFKSRGIAPEIVQICASRAKTAGGLHLMMAQNPIYIISGGGK